MSETAPLLRGDITSTGLFSADLEGLELIICEKPKEIKLIKMGGIHSSGSITLSEFQSLDAVIKGTR